MSIGRSIVAFPLALLLAGGCSFIDRAISSGVNAAADSAGKKVGNQVGNSLAAKYNPMLSQMYMQMVFAMAFGSGGYAVGQASYQPGDYTRWSIPNDDSESKAKESQMERAYLFNDRDGNQWWKVKWVLDPADASKSTLIVEALFEKGTWKLLRQRAKMPNEQEGAEVPVDDQSYYSPPRQLTKQSLEGGTVGIEKVTVPAGTFTAKHVSYGDMSGKVDFWLVDSVPGSAVKYLHGTKGSDGETNAQNWQMLLTAYGKGATSELGVKR